MRQVCVYLVSRWYEKIGQDVLEKDEGEQRARDD